MKLILAVLILAGFACAQVPVNIKTPPPPALQVPREEILEIRLADLNIPVTQLTLTQVLPKQPAPGTIIEAVYTSSQFGASIVAKRKPEATMTPIMQRTLVFDLPTFRPFTSADIITVTWKTLEP